MHLAATLKGSQLDDRMRQQSFLRIVRRPGHFES